MNLTKLQSKAALDSEFSQSETMTPGEYSLKLAAIDQQPHVELSAPDHPDIYATILAVRASLETVASVVAPLTQRLAALERKLQTLESKQNGITIAAEAVSIDGLAGMAEAVSMLNQTLSQPIKPIYDAKGILIGARRVPRLDS